MTSDPRQPAPDPHAQARVLDDLASAPAFMANETDDLLWREAARAGAACLRRSGAQENECGKGKGGDCDCIVCAHEMIDRLEREIATLQRRSGAQRREEKHPMEKVLADLDALHRRMDAVVEEEDNASLAADVTGPCLEAPREACSCTGTRRTYEHEGVESCADCKKPIEV